MYLFRFPNPKPPWNILRWPASSAMIVLSVTTRMTWMPELRKRFDSCLSHHTRPRWQDVLSEILLLFTEPPPKGSIVRTDNSNPRLIRQSIPSSINIMCQYCESKTVKPIDMMMGNKESFNFFSAAATSSGENRPEIRSAISWKKSSSAS